MLAFLMRLAAFAALASLLPISSASAHCLIGGRFLPATLSVDDPCVADELSLPTVAVFKNGDDPSARQLDISGEYSKRITDWFGVSIGQTWTRLRPFDGPAVSGFQNLETTFKAQTITNAAHEFVLSFGVSVEWGRTGSAAVGAEDFSVITPTLWFGKGFGDLPGTMSWLRPFAVTGQVGYAIPSRAATTTFGIDPLTGDPTADTEQHTRFVAWGGSLQYSMPYLKAQVVDLGLPDFFNRLIPIVEVNFLTPAGNNPLGLRTTGTINPGVIWVGRYYQVGLEAMIPINRESGRGVGFVGQLHFYLDDIFPTGIGRPIFTSMSPAGRSFGG
jgi:hypothetical protein